MVQVRHPQLFLCICASDSIEQFSNVFLNIVRSIFFRGFWTLVSFVMEGVNQPSVSFKTKIYGLILGIPVTVVLGSEFGAIGGAVGYGVMNGIIFGYVIWFSYGYFERVIIDWTLLKYFVLSMIVTILVTKLTVSLLMPMGGSIGISVIGSVVSLGTYGGCLYMISSKAKHVINRAYLFYVKQRLQRLI